MATNTSIIGLVKPTYEEDQDITVLNANSDLIDAEAGRLRNNFAGTYSASRGYAVGDYCVYTGNLYRCTTAIGSGGEAWNSSHWTQVKVGEELGSLSDQIGYNATLIGTFYGLGFWLIKSGGSYGLKIQGTLTQALSGNTSYETINSSYIDNTEFQDYVCAIEFNQSIVFGFYRSNNKLNIIPRGDYSNGSSISFILNWTGNP